MKVGFTADLHGFLPEVPKCDLLIIAGDVTHEHNVDAEVAYLEGTFRTWLENLPMPVVGVAGNHDFAAEWRPDMMYKLPWRYLSDEGAEIKGLKIWGSPYSNKFGRWAFMETEQDLAHRWSAIPHGLDILITHGPPYGFGDLVTNDWHPDDPHVGSRSLAGRVLRTQPRYHVFGHIHEAYGVYQLGTSSLINASLVNEKYVKQNRVVVFNV